ncbi:MAG: exosome complex protein Rrp42 [Candidatus Micrarchaeota archaeon]|nr:exosome complex protein Rrp42 [Candidatus Micrarchaeota archaeon]
MEIIDEIKKDMLFSFLSKGRRADGRGMMDFRKIVVQPSPLQNAEGSSLVAIGKTQVIVGIKFDIAAPFPDKPDEGILSTSADLLPLASSMFEAGPPSDESIELARVVDRGIRSANTIDLKSFFIEEGKVLALYIDIYVLDHDGNMFDASALAAMQALLCTRLPKIEDGKIVRGEYAGKLPTKDKVVSCTFGKLGDKVFIDPSLDEERGMDCRITFATTPTHICAGQKGGWGAFSYKDIVELSELAIKKGDELRSLLRD